MKRRDDEFLEPDLTPLIDVVFILLIFFLVTSVFKKQELAIVLNLPVSDIGSKERIEAEDITIELKDNKLIVSGIELTIEKLASLLTDKDPKITVHIRSDRLTQYYRVIEILDILKKHQFLNVNLVTEK